MEMFDKKDPAHLQAMQKIQDLVQDPNAMNTWFEEKKKEFNALPDD